MKQLTKLIMYIIIALGLTLVNPQLVYSSNKAMIKVSGGIGYKIDSKYDDTLANVDVTYLSNYESNFMYGLSVGSFRMKHFYLKKNGVDFKKVEGYQTMYACLRGGVSVRPANFMYMEFISGPCYFEKARILISGNLQFNTEVGYGLRDVNTGSSIGIVYRHFSNGGIKDPNYGANLYLFTMGILF